MPSSLSSQHGTGVSELHQGGPTPPGRNIQPRPRRPHSPAKTKRVWFMNSFVDSVFIYLPSINYRTKLKAKFVHISLASRAHTLNQLLN